MKSIIFFYGIRIIAIAIAAFFLGLLAHLLKQIASSLATGSENGSSEKSDQEQEDAATA